MPSPVASDVPTVRARRGFHFQPRTVRAVCFFALLVAAPVLVIVGATLSRRPGAVATGPGPASATRPAATAARPTGPWGELELNPVALEPPPAHAARLATLLDLPRWYFRAATPATVDEFLKSAGLGDEQRYALLQTCTDSPQIEGVSVRPTPELIFSLNNDVREAIYERLAAESRNLQAEPFRRPADAHVEPWFAHAGLGDENARLANKLVYRRGPLECFADVSAILAVVQTDDERVKLFRALSRQTSLAVSLRVRGGADVKPLVAYWGRNGREAQVAPPLAELAARPDGGTIDVIKLLPPFVASRYHTFAELPDSGLVGPEDCHFTSLNFWNDQADRQFLSPDTVMDTLLTAYHKVDKADQLGDILLLVDARGKGVHSAVYVADDLFFSKNGGNAAAPWMLIRRAEMMDYYAVLGVTRTTAFRKNGL